MYKKIIMLTLRLGALDERRSNYSMFFIDFDPKLFLGDEETAPFDKIHRNDPFAKRP